MMVLGISLELLVTVTVTISGLRASRLLIPHLHDSFVCLYKYK